MFLFTGYRTQSPGPQGFSLIFTYSQYSIFPGPDHLRPHKLSSSAGPSLCVEARPGAQTAGASLARREEGEERRGWSWNLIFTASILSSPDKVWQFCRGAINPTTALKWQGKITRIFIKMELIKACTENPFHSRFLFSSLCCQFLTFDKLIPYLPWCGIVGIFGKVFVFLALSGKFLCFSSLMIRRLPDALYV